MPKCYHISTAYDVGEKFHLRPMFAFQIIVPTSLNSASAWRSSDRILWTLSPVILFIQLEVRYSETSGYRRLFIRS